MVGRQQECAMFLDMLESRSSNRLVRLDPPEQMFELHVPLAALHSLPSMRSGNRPYKFSMSRPWRANEAPQVAQGHSSVMIPTMVQLECAVGIPACSWPNKLRKSYGRKTEA